MAIIDFGVEYKVTDFACKIIEELDFAHHTNKMFKSVGNLTHTGQSFTLLP